MIAFRLRSLAETTSTNDEVKRALEAGELEGLVVRARRQVAGYGRQGRTWTSPDGGLYCSLLLRPQVAVRELPTLSLVVGMSVRRALAGIAPQAGDRIRIKWPNDVVLLQGGSEENKRACKSSFAKLCGISLEAHAGGLCVGVGVNVLPPSEHLDVGGKNRAAYVADLVDGAPPSIEAVLDALLAEFSPLHDEWMRAGFAALADEFNAYASLAGCGVSMVDHLGNALASGQVVRVDGFGRLVLRDAAGIETPVSSGEAHIV